MNKYIASYFLIVLIDNVQAAEINNTSVTGTTFKFTATLNTPLTAGNKVSIDFGKGLKTMTCVAKTCTLSSTALPSGVGTAAYKIGIYDAKNILQGTTSNGTYVITSNFITPTLNSTIPTKGYTKIGNNGSDLPDNAMLGEKQKDWACTRDNTTSLMWEVKTDDNGLRDKDWQYTWYEPDVNKNGGDAGTQNNNVNACMAGADNCNTHAYQVAVNSKQLCNANDWRMPTIAELNSVVKSSEESLRIEKTYFPNTASKEYWSSSTHLRWSNLALNTKFGYSGQDSNKKNDHYNVLLVRNAP